MTSQGENDVLETIDSLSDQEFPLMFVNKLVSIFEHSKEEITELLKSKSLPALKQLRDLPFSELVSKLPQYAGREMYARRKGDLLAEDIYVYGFSAINALPDRRLSKCMKPTLDLDSTSLLEQEPENNDIHNIQSLTELCIQLQDNVRKLQETVKAQENRIMVLETQVTVDQIKSLGASTNTSTQNRSRDQAEGGVPEQPHRADPGTQVPVPQPGDDQQQRPASQPQAAASGDDANGGAPGQQHVNPGPQGAPPHLADNATHPNGGEDADFRHSARERKDILRGNIGIMAAVQQNDIRGSSKRAHCISAVKQSTAGTHLVYVGGLSPDTTANDLRRHLSSVNITNIADVIDLKGKYRSKQASFCVSFDNVNAMQNAFKCEFWPEGVHVRTFRAGGRRSPKATDHQGRQSRRDYAQDRQNGWRDQGHPGRETPAWQDGRRYENDRQGPTGEGHLGFVYRDYNHGSRFYCLPVY